MRKGIPVKRHRCTGKKTPGGAGTHTRHTRDTRARAQRHTDHADEPHSHPNPPTTHIPQTYTGRRTTVGGIDTHAPRARTRYRQATTARNTDWRCGRVARWTNTPRERIFKDPAPTPRPSYVRPSHTTSIGPHAGSSYNWPPRAPEQLLTTTTCPPCRAHFESTHKVPTSHYHTKHRLLAYLLMCLRAIAQTLACRMHT
jgi:hypothetical protein